MQARSRATFMYECLPHDSRLRAFARIFNQCSFDVHDPRLACPTTPPTTPAYCSASLHLTLLFHSHALPFVGPFSASASDRSPPRTLLHPREVSRHAVGTRLVVTAHTYSLFWQWNWKTPSSLPSTGRTPLLARSFGAPVRQPLARGSIVKNGGREGTWAR